jgi:hypothetical protein
MKINSKIFVYSIIYIIFLTCFCFAEEKKEFNIDKFSKTIISLIKKGEAKELIKYLNSTVLLSERVPLTSFSNKNGYDGFIKGEGLLYAVFFDIKKVKGEWEKLLVGSNYKSLRDAFSESKKINQALEDKLPVIHTKYKEKDYNIIFERISDTEYKIVEIALDRPPWED